MKKLFLCSFFKDAFPLFDQSVEGKRIAFIPTAANVEKIAFYVSSARKALEQAGATIMLLDIAAASPEEIKSTLEKSDFIYISGGNTFYLLQEMKRSGADKLICDFVNAGKPYIGESAGAMLVSPNIEYAAAMDSIKKAPELTGYDALGLTDFYAVPHEGYGPFKRPVGKIIEKYASSLTLCPISNKQAISVNGNEHQILGE
jgi:Peptidase E